MRLCPVWPLSVKMESSAEAYGKPQPSPRQSTTEAHSPEKPSETFCQNVSTCPLFYCNTLLSYSLTQSQEHENTVISEPFIQRYRSVTYRTAVLS